jgi:alkyldihydroxyacetonephosphate synthase
MALARPPSSYPQLSWWGWGDPAEVPSLPDGVRELLAGALGVRSGSARVGSLSEVALPPSRLPDEVASRLTEVVGHENASSAPEARARHAGGKSAIDLLRIRAGQMESAPDLVISPASHDEVLEVVRICSAHRVAVVPFGGGTSVVGGLSPESEAFTGLIALDTRRMNALLNLDEQSLVARLEPGLRGPQAEELLAARGYTLGHFPQSFEYATLGGFAAARSSGQASAGYGRFDDLVVGIRVATPSGTLELGRAPKSAAGPDLRQLILGSEGALGVITSLTAQLRRSPDARVYEGWRFESFAEGALALRKLIQDGPVPTVLRLSDEAETAVSLAQPERIGEASGGGALAIVGYEGSREEVRSRQAAVTEALRADGAVSDPDAGESWARDRFRGPYLRDALLDEGALVDTLETVTFWSSLERVYRAVGDALRDSLIELGTPPVIMCHISHVYRAGASLYFTVACAMTDDPIAQWRAAKAAANDAITSNGASISHHHGVGSDHRDWLSKEIGELGVEMLAAVKARLDPAGILNPGVLIPVGQPHPA